MKDFTAFLYRTVPGRILLCFLTDRRVSALCGIFLDSRFSAWLIPLFVKKNGIRLEEFETSGMKSFNDCFSRKILPGMRTADMNPESLIAPCDGLLRAYPIRHDMVLNIKEAGYTLTSLLHSRKLAERYEGGLCLVFRLRVDHYHRYCYVDSGKKSRNIFIPGCLHTVRPAALETVPVFVSNCREYTLIRTESFGTVVQMEVGAMLVGRICNHMQEGHVCRGEEKGYFQYGGSTVIVLLEKNRAQLNPGILEASRQGCETPVQMGQKIGKACQQAK